MGITYSGFTAQTPQRLVVGPGAVYLNYGLPGERLLGATDGGNSFNLGITYRDIEVDKPFGLVKGLRLIDDIQPMITANLKELGVDNLKLAVPGLKEVSGTMKTEIVPAEYLGDGDGSTVAFTVANADVVDGSLRVYLDGVLQAETTDYTAVLSTGVITFVTAPAASKPVTAAYAYNTGTASDHTILRVNPLETSDYLDNVALLGTATGHDKPVVVVLKNVLASVDGDIDLPNKDEITLPVNFAGMFDPADIEALLGGTKTLPEIAPLEIRWPLS